MSAIENRTADRHVTHHAHVRFEDDALLYLAGPIEPVSPFSNLPTEIVAMIARAVLMRPEEVDISYKRNRMCPPLYLVSRDFATIGLKFANYFRDNTFVITSRQELRPLIELLILRTVNPPICTICKIVIDFPLEAIDRTLASWVKKRYHFEICLCIVTDDRCSIKRQSGAVRLRPTWAGSPVLLSELTPEIVWITQAVQVFADLLMTQPSSKYRLRPLSIDGVVNTAARSWKQDQELEMTGEAKTLSNNPLVDPDVISFQRWKSNLDMAKHAAHMRRLRTFE
ncbi:hypothetical protein BDV97DRAFT_421520 [Delphinella strobiligena]|nr:hypothetical protein BDV97DRAFT_421520 [Delphinella strobiligena]